MCQFYQYCMWVSSSGCCLEGFSFTARIEGLEWNIDGGCRCFRFCGTCHSAVVAVLPWMYCYFAALALQSTLDAAARENTRFILFLYFTSLRSVFTASSILLSSGNSSGPQDCRDTATHLESWLMAALKRPAITASLYMCGWVFMQIHRWAVQSWYWPLIKHIYLVICSHTKTELHVKGKNSLYDNLTMVHNIHTWYIILTVSHKPPLCVLCLIGSTVFICLTF